MEEKEIHDELSAIRNLMERSSKFISLSGLSGILAGVYALIGAGLAYMLLKDTDRGAEVYINGAREQLDVAPFFNRNLIDYSSLVWKLIFIAIIVLLASVITAIMLSTRQAKRKNQPMWGAVSRQLLFNMTVPLLAGGGLIAILIFFKINNISHVYYGLVAPVSLIFYGLALVSASNFTFGEVKYLGLCEITIGLIAACLPGHGLLFWALGFGVLHIIYGSRIYLKYDR